MTTVNYEYYVSLEVAKLLKEAGFDWECSKIYYCYHEDGDTWKLEDNYRNYRSILKLDHCLLTPTLEVAQRWLREIKGVHMCVKADAASINCKYFVTVVVGDTKWGNVQSENKKTILLFNTYEEAQEAGIKKVVEMILEKGE